MSEQYILGIDGGGTKTDAVLCDGTGRVIARAVGGPSSVTGQSEEAAQESLRDTLKRVLEQTGGLSTPLAGFFAGISGAGLGANRVRFERIFRELLPGLGEWDVNSDSYNALSAGVGVEDGIIAIAGTGSSVFGRKDGVMRQVGGWGYLLGDEGSGFDLGRRALISALKAMDGRAGKETLLYELCRQQAGGSLRDFVPELYRQNAKAVVASYAPLLLQAARTGDETAQEQLSQALDDMACAIRVAHEYCGSFRVVQGGSIWKDETYCAGILARLGGQFTLLAPDLPPVYGSLVLAASLAGLPHGEGFKKNVGETLK